MIPSDEQRHLTVGEIPPPNLTLNMHSNNGSLTSRSPHDPHSNITVPPPARSLTSSCESPSPSPTNSNGGTAQMPLHQMGRRFPPVHPSVASSTVGEFLVFKITSKYILWYFLE